MASKKDINSDIETHMNRLQVIENNPQLYANSSRQFIIDTYKRIIKSLKDELNAKTKSKK